MKLEIRNQRLGRVPCGKPLAFRTSSLFFGGYAAWGQASAALKPQTGKPKAFRTGKRPSRKKQISASPVMSF